MFRSHPNSFSRKSKSAFISEEFGGPLTMFFQKMNTFQGFQGAGRPQFFMRCPRLCNYHILLLALKGCYRCRRWCQVTTGTSCGTKKLNSGSNINKEMKNSNTHPPEMDITNSTRTCARGKLPAIPRSYREKTKRLLNTSSTQ